MNTPLDAARFEYTSAVTAVEEAEERRADLHAQLVTAERDLTAAKHRLSAVTAEVQRLEREPQDLQLFGELAERVRALLSRAPAHSPSAAAVRGSLAALETSDVPAAARVEAVRELLRRADPGALYKLDRDIWDSKVPPLAGRE